jgi:3-hydroxymyristoyl/3-hydroxydecanoyl-(acyl carrier protein) dehydratase
MDSSIPLIAPLNHPCYEGHFPGNPVVPGVLLLELVVVALGRGPPRAIPSVKFHRALAPGESFELQWKSAAAATGFRCVRGDVLIADGTFEFGPPA